VNVKSAKSKVISLVHVIISIAIMVVAMISARIISNLISEALSLNVIVDDLIYSMIYIFSALIIGLTYAKYILHLSAEDIGVKKCFPRMKWIVVGILLPVIVSVFYLIFAEGVMSKNSIYSIEGEIAAIISGVWVTGISAGIVEEFIFRGLIMHISENAWNRKVAIIVPSLIFGAAHLNNISEGRIADAILLVVAGSMVGVMFSLIAYQSGSIWASAIVHALWNIVIIGGILQITSTDAGMNVNSIYYYKLDGSNILLTGGIYGIEVAVPAIIGYLLMSAAILLQEKVK